MRRFGFLFLGAAASVGLLSAPAAAQTLKDALSMAYATNPTLAAARARYRVVREQEPAALSNLLPSASASGSYAKLNDTSKFNATAFGGAGVREVTSNLHPLSAAVDINQTVFSGFRNIAALRAATARVKAGGAELAGAEQALLQNAATAYFDVLRDTKVYEANVNQVDVLSKQADETAARFKVGEVTRTDVAQSNARLAAARAALSVAQAQLTATRAIFAEVIGEAPATLETSPATPDAPETLEAAIDLAKTLSPAVLAARQNAEAARRQVAVARSAFAPTVSVGATYSYAEEQNPFLVSNEQFTYGVRARVPLFNGGLDLSRLRQAKAEADAARAGVDEAGRRAEAAATAAFGRVIATRQTITAAKAQVEANTSALDGVRREHDVGARTTLDVLDAEQELLNAEVSLAGAERDQRVAVVTLLAGVGALTPEALGVDTKN